MFLYFLKPQKIHPQFGQITFWLLLANEPGASGPKDCHLGVFLALSRGALDLAASVIVCGPSCRHAGVALLLVTVCGLECRRIASSCIVF